MLDERRLRSDGGGKTDAFRPKADVSLSFRDG